MNDLNASNTRRPGRRVAAGLAAIAVTLTLTSCGGSSSDDGGAAAPVAASLTLSTAAQSVDGFIAYLKVLVATRPETTNPLDVSTFVAPTTETGTPDLSI